MLSCARFRRSCDRRSTACRQRWMADPVRLRRACEAAVRTLIALPASTPSLRLLADQTAKVLDGISDALDGLALLVGAPARSASSPPWRPAPRARLAAFSRQCGARVRHDRRRRALLDRDRMAERCLGHHLRRDRGPPVCAASRSGLRGRHGFHGRQRPRRRFRGDHRICGAAGAWRPSRPSASPLVFTSYPPALCIAQPGQTAMFAAMVVNFVPLLAPANQMSYDTVQFYNAALAIVAGSGVGGLFVSLAAASVAGISDAPAPGADLARSAPPRDGSRPLDGRRLGGSHIRPARGIAGRRPSHCSARSSWRRYRWAPKSSRLRRIASSLGLGPDLDAALEALARGNSAIATARLARLDDRLASRPDGGSGRPLLSGRAGVSL